MDVDELRHDSPLHQRGASGATAADEPARHVYDSVEAIAGLYASAEERVGRHQRLIERFTAFLARPRILYSILAIVALWIAWNSAAPLLRFRAIDPPPFVWLQGTIGLLAVVMANVVIITQHRQGRRADHRSHLDLQVSVLAEQKIAKLIALVEELRRDLPVRERRDDEAESMARPADPALVASAIEDALDDDR